MDFQVTDIICWMFLQSGFNKFGNIFFFKIAANIYVNRR